MSQNDLGGKPKVTAYKWLKRGAVDPDEDFVWSDIGQQELTLESESSTGVHAYLLGGLPYAMEDELWEVELRDVAHPALVSDLNTRDELKRQHQKEVTLLSRTGSLVRHIVAWTPQVADEFARECALEARGCVLQALSDATKVLSDAQAEDAHYRPEHSDVSRAFLNSAAELEARGREALIAAHSDLAQHLVQRSRCARVAGSAGVGVRGRGSFVASCGGAYVRRRDRPYRKSGGRNRSGRICRRTTASGDVARQAAGPGRSHRAPL